MTWTDDDFPPEMLSLQPKVRHKAIEIANKLIAEDNFEPANAIKEAIERAKLWEIDEQG